MAMVNANGNKRNNKSGVLGFDSVSLSGSQC